MTNPLILTVLGMSITLIILYTINLMIVAFGKLLSAKEVPAVPAAPAAAALQPPAPAQDDQDELAAVIAAAIYSCAGGFSRPALHVRPLVSSGAPAAWTNAYRAESTLLR
jgi:sodium pump decarboxylase gamma subunit